MRIEEFLAGRLTPILLGWTFGLWMSELAWMVAKPAVVPDFDKRSNVRAAAAVLLLNLGLVAIVLARRLPGLASDAIAWGDAPPAYALAAAWLIPEALRRMAPGTRTGDSLAKSARFLHANCHVGNVVGLAAAAALAAAGIVSLVNLSSVIAASLAWWSSRKTRVFTTR